MTAYSDLVDSLSPVAQYKLNETSGTVCTDSSGNGNNGTYVNSPVLGKNSLLFGDYENGAVDFEAASSQYVSFTGNELTDEINGAAAVAIEMWGTVEAFAASLYVANLVIDSTNDGLNLLFDASGVQIGARSVTGDTLQTLHYNWTTINTIAHFVAIADFANDALYIFKDGAQVARSSVTFTNASYTKGTPSANDTVARGQTAANYYDGQLCNINIYNKALTPLQIRQLYRAGIAKGFDAEVMKLSGLKGYWPLGETSGDAKDWSGNENNGTVTGATQGATGGLVSAANANDKAYTFDGASGDVQITDQTAIQNVFDSGGAAGIWVNTTSDGEANLGRLFDKTNWLLSVSDEAAGKVKLKFTQKFSTTDGVWTSTATEVDLSTPAFVVVVYDNSAVGNDPTVYVNGASVTMTEDTTPVGTRTSDVASDLYIGNDSAGAATFDGKQQKPFLFSATITAAQIRTLYQSGIVDLIDRGFAKVLQNLSPDGYWRMGEGADRGIVFDDSGNDNDGVPTSVTFAATGGLHQDLATALTLDGAAGEVSITDEANLQNIFDGAGGSVLAIIKATSDGEGDAGRIVDKRGAAGSGWALYVSGESGGSAKVSFHQDFDTTDGIWDTTAADLPLGAYALVALTYDADAVGNDPIIYIDGASSAVTEASTPVGTRVSDAGSDWLTGNDDAGGSTFDGSIMQVAHLKGTILTAQQVKQLYEAFRSRFAAEMISKQPVGYWRQNEASGTTSIDYGSGGNNGTYTNGPLLAQTTTPITNEAGHTTVDYDGTSQYNTASHSAETSVDGTLLFFMNPPASPPASSENPMGLRSASNDLFQVDFRSGTGNVMMRYRDSGASIINVDGGISLPASQWSFVVGAADNTNDSYRIYVDGLEQNESTTVLSGTFSASKTVMGAVNDGSFIAHYDGGIAEAARFNTVLTTSDILDILEMATFIPTIASFDLLPGQLYPVFSLQQPPTNRFIKQIGI